MDRLNFDFDRRVTERYDALRGHPPEASAQIAAGLLARLPPAPEVLEIGVGTGRIAIPLATAGACVVGIDRSDAMLAVLRDQAASADDRLEAVLGDAEALPFTAERFDAVLCVHVLHLLTHPAAALAGFYRVLKPGGLLILGRDWVDPQSFAGDLRNAFRRIVMELGPDVPAGAGARELPALAAAAGFVPAIASDASTPESVLARWQASLAPQDMLAGIRSRDDAESWVLPDTLLAQVMTRLDTYARDTNLDLTTAQTVERRFLITTLQRPSGDA
ncbi:MAG: class I SAM-dependent methyltransferase [Pseudomonadota bacterium]